MSHLTFSKLVLPALLLLAIAAMPERARAQVDSPAAREARAALHEAREKYRTRPEWDDWAAKLNLPDVQFEILAGDRGEPGVLSAAVVELVSGREPQFAEPPFVRLAKALDVRAQELKPLPGDQWAEACAEQLENYRTISDETVEAGRAACQRWVDRFAREFPPVSTPGSKWNDYLLWEDTLKLCSSLPIPEREVLDRLDMRWASAPTVWDNSTLYEASLAVRIYVRLLRGHLFPESPEQHAAAWNELSQLLADYASEGGDTTKIAAAVNAREQRGEASRLTMSIRHALSQPNMVVKINNEWLQSQLTQQIDEPFEVNGVFAGTRSVGRGRLVGQMAGKILPSSAIGRWLLEFNGTSTARASGSQDRVYVVSRATTQVAGSKPFVVDSRGLTPLGAHAEAKTSIVYERIDSDGLPRRRSQAVSETNARRPQAERESAVYARRSILDRINQEADQVASDFNQQYHASLRDVRINSLRPSPEIRVRSADGTMLWECLLEGPATFGAPKSAPDYSPDSEVVMSIAASALEEQAMVSLGGQDLSGAELLKRMGGVTGEQTLRNADAFNVSFASHPCDVTCTDDAVNVRLYISKFDSDDVQYPAMSVDVSYRPETRDGRVVFVRQGRVRVKPLATSEGEAPKISGRQQTLRLAVERKLAKVFTSEFAGAEVKLPLAGGGQASLGMTDARLTGSWIQLALSPVDAP